MHARKYSEIYQCYFNRTCNFCFNPETAVSRIIRSNNLSNGFLPSTSTEICDEIALVFPRVIAEGPIPLEKQGQDHAKIVDVERIKPITQVNRGNCKTGFAAQL